MKNLILALFVVSMVPFTSAKAVEISVDENAAPALFDALAKAGAEPRGPSAISQTVRVTDLGCSGGYNQFLHRATYDCEFTDGDKHIRVSRTTARNLLSAMIDAKLIKQGPAEMSAGSVKALDCIMSNFDGARTYTCTASN